MELNREDYSRGLVKGYEIGERKIAEKIAKKMLLELKLNIATVRKVTELPKAQLKQILEESEED